MPILALGNRVKRDWVIVTDPKDPSYMQDSSRDPSRDPLYGGLGGGQGAPKVQTNLTRLESLTTVISVMGCEDSGI
jgi:hypothetical protein